MHIWRENGRPRDGTVASVMRRTRALYHYKVRAISKGRQKIQKQKLVNAAVYGTQNEFWREVKTLKGKKDCMPSTVDGQNSDKDISNLFATKYEELYTSVPYDKNVMNDIISNVDCNLKHLTETGCCYRVTVNDIEKAVKKLKQGKQDGSQTFYSDHIIYGPQRLYVLLSILFTAMITHGVSPHIFLCSVLQPIPKNVHKDMEDSTNYRAIALMNALMKLLDWVVIIKNEMVLQSCVMQHGFSDGTSTNTCTFMVKETVNYYLSSTNAGKCYGVMIDASKAFDRVDFSLLFKELLQRNLPSPIIRLLLVIYRNQNMVVKWNNAKSAAFNVVNGVRQGGVLSPILFCIYIDEMLTCLKQSKIGCNVGNLYCGAFGYADDVILLSPNVGSLQTMLDICCEYAVSKKIIFNSDKSKLVLFSRDIITFVPELYMTNAAGVKQKLELDPSPTYLGHKLSHDLLDENDIVMQTNKFNSKANAVLSDFKNVCMSQRFQLLVTFCTSFYGSQLWATSKGAMEVLYKSYRAGVKKAFNLPFRTHTYILPIITDSFHLEQQLDIRQLKFVKKCMASKNTDLKCMMQYMLNSWYSVYGCNIREVLHKYSMIHDVYINSNVSYIINSVKNHHNSLYSTEMLNVANIIKEMLLMKEDQNFDIFDVEELQFCIYSLCTI